MLGVSEPQLLQKEAVGGHFFHASKTPAIFQTLSILPDHRAYSAIACHKYRCVAESRYSLPFGKETIKARCFTYPQPTPFE